ncbi:MAG: extracellular solute-binding protein [Anaerolineaceae bacterium]|nr:extracellular solute-binding protein [Anaerolineaceae bacterium]
MKINAINFEASSQKSLPAVPRKAVGGLLFIFVFLAVFLAGCTTPATATVTPSIDVAKQTVTTSPLPTPVKDQTLIIWLPPQFDPNTGTASAEIFRRRLDQFIVENPGVKLDLRIRSLEGPANLLNMLTITNAAAPVNLPSIVALPRDAMEIAVLKSLIYPLDNLVPAVDNSDWFSYAQQMAIIQGRTYGVPFAGDSLVLVYRPKSVGGAPEDWKQLFARGLPLAFPAADPFGTLPLQLYLSTSAPLKDPQGRPFLEPEALERVFRIMDQGTQQGVFPYNLSEMKSFQESWRAFQEKRVNWAVTWSSNYLSSLIPDTTAALVPSMGSKPHALTSGWLWCIADPDPKRQKIAAKLVEYLSDSQFMAEWTASTGYLPSRPSALDAWSNKELRLLIGKIISAAVLVPDVDVLGGTTPLLAEYTLQLIKGQTDPGKAVREVQDRLKLSQ